MRRRELRLRGFDYSSAGLYYVTVCARAQALVFGEVVDDEVHPSRVGAVARACLLEVAEHHAGAVVDSYVVMPNHVHVVLATEGTPLGVIVGTFKAAVTRATGNRQLWQRGYHDHVIRDEADLTRVREYIATNPIRWMHDPENSARSP